MAHKKIDYVKEWNDNADRIRANREFKHRYDIKSGIYSRITPEERLLLKLVNRKSKVLDVGCGIGRMMRLFPKSFGIDVSDKMLEMNPFKNRIKQMDITQNADLKKKSFDVIFLLRVVLHLRGEVIDEVLMRLNGLLKDDGFLYIDAQTKADMDEIKWKFKRIYWALTGKLTPVSAKAITSSKLKKILDKHGFSYKIYNLTETNWRESKKHSKSIFKIKKLK